jgi:predicted O-linked N-acetylglucosamine transferase (SPINDLY family)
MMERGSDWDVMLALKRGFDLQQRGRLDEAEAEYARVLQIAPAHPDAVHFMGLIEAQRGRPQQAAALLEQSLGNRPSNVAALFNYASVLRALGRTEDAIATYDRILAIKPDHFRAIADRGSALHQLGNIVQALECYDRSLALHPAQPVTLYNRANALHALGRHEDAILDFSRALALKADHIDAVRNRARLLCDLGRHQAALAGCDEAIVQNPAIASLHTMRGDILVAVEKQDDALSAYDRALAIDPRQVDALFGRSEILARRMQYQEALTDLNRALSIVPDDFRGLGNRGRILTSLQRFKDACADFERALSLRPDHPYLQGSILECKLNCCDWRTIGEDRAALRVGIHAGRRVARPVVNLIASDSPDIQLQGAKIWIQNEFVTAPVWSGERYEHDRVRVGYLAPEFGFNPVATQMAGIFENHDKSRFEITLLPFGRGHGSDILSRIESACERTIDIHQMSDGEVARRLRSMELDILVDLAGLSGSNRTGVLALRPAPIQVCYLGFPGTTGADFIDYFIADRVVIPESHRHYYTENVVYLPDTYMPNDSRRSIALRNPTRSELGLPAEGFVFCCFNNSFKYTPEVFDVWMRLLRKVEKSVLWLPRFNDAAVENLKKEAENRKVNPERVVFARYVRSPEDHLARLQVADLCLDTLPYNAHATACDALWVGLPVLTCMGSTFTGRVGASLLRAVGLPDLVTQTLEEYEALALKLATEPSLLAHVKATLIQNRSSSTLFDTARSTRNLEAAYDLMVQRHRSGQSPAPFAI